MRIYVDFDDVLCATAQGLSRLARQLFGRRVPFAQIRCFDLRQAFRISAAEHQDLMDHAHAPQFLQRLPALDGSAACLRDWLREGHEVAVVTGRPSTTDPASRAWLRRHGLAPVPILYVDKYQRYPRGPSHAPPMLSLDELRRQRFDWLIDDSPVALDALLSHHAGRAIVFDRPWNRAYPCAAPQIIRCRGWRDIRRHVR
jgi:5'(3')-deoxyribonucleotidase